MDCKKADAEEVCMSFNNTFENDFCIKLYCVFAENNIYFNPSHSQLKGDTLIYYVTQLSRQRCNVRSLIEKRDCDHDYDDKLKKILF